MGFDLVENYFSRPGDSANHIRYILANGVALFASVGGSNRLRATIEADAASVVLTIGVQFDAALTRSALRPVRRLLATVGHV
jgi:hypothetical protein